MTAPSIVRLKITLDHVGPVVTRRITVRFSIRLDRLHSVLQAAMGWTDSHLWEFRAGGTGWGPRDPNRGFADGPHDATTATLLGVLSEVGGKSIKYLYYFGDGWEHTIKIEKVFPDVPGLAQSFLLEASGRCPPKDIGGSGGYAEFLEAIADPNHERHAEFVEWYGTDSNPDTQSPRSPRRRRRQPVAPTRNGGRRSIFSLEPTLTLKPRNGDQDGARAA